MGSFVDNHFELYSPKFIEHYADRRWVLHPFDNIWTKLGFAYRTYTEPRCYYTNLKLWKINRKRFVNIDELIHSHLKEAYNESNKDYIIKNLGYDRIWDCGAIRYVWKKTY